MSEEQRLFHLYAANALGGLIAGRSPEYINGHLWDLTCRARHIAHYALQTWRNEVRREDDE